MGIFYFASLVFNLLIFVIPLAAWTTILAYGAVRSQRRRFLNYLPFTASLALVITALSLYVLADDLRDGGVYALSPFASVTQRPALLGVLVVSVLGYMVGTNRKTAEQVRTPAWHIALACAASAFIQCAGVVFVPEALYGLMDVRLYH